MTVNKPVIILLTGASGSGKTTLAKALEQYLPKHIRSVYYFDDVGVPTNERMIEEYGSTKRWQEWATHRWIERLHSIKDKKLTFLEGSFYPEFAIDKMQELGIKNYLVICLSAEKSVRENRLIEGRMQPELATVDMERYDQALKAQTLNSGGVVVDSSHKDVQEILEEILCLIQYPSLLERGG